MKIIGFVVGWACEDFIGPSLEQAIDYCDEVLVCVAPYTDVMKEFEDNTANIVSAFTEYKRNNKVKIVYHTEMSYHTFVKPSVLNKMISSSDNFEVGNWIWILDSDEFYTRESFENIKKVLNEPHLQVDQFGVEEKFFMYNMQHYLTGMHNRLFKINDISNRFIPTQIWTGTSRTRVLKTPDVEMYHYSMLSNPYAKEAFWKTEYPGKSQSKKTVWLNEIYKNYDLNDEDYWINKNYELTGLYSPWYADNFKGDKYNHNKLFKYNGVHPKYIEDTQLPYIKDFREYFKF